ncbi:MAG TPA: hypothetical protein P5081_12980 [Phycisphaerae bacterium]|nr:hypothetical protein [Phycisphaerae bacterium]HRW53790.1 hypothetical protein [Phycisphaerae bacterium]
MALISRGMSRCPICNEVIRAEHHIFATWGVWLETDHKLFRYCDAGMHWDCYAHWPHRPEFAKSYIDFWFEWSRESPYSGFVFVNDEALVSVARETEIVTVRVFSTGVTYVVGFDQWRDWLRAPTLGPKAHPLEFESVLAILPTLRRHCHRLDDLVDSIDWEAKRLVAEAIERRWKAAREEEERAKQARKRNRRCVRFWLRLRRNDWACPVCRTRDFRLIQRQGVETRVDCRGCGTAFTGTEAERSRFESVL